MGKRERTQVICWLDISKHDDMQIIKEIEHLKKSRKFTQTLRDGLRLIFDLRKGRTDVLLELFPLIARRLTESEQVNQELLEIKRLIQAGYMPRSQSGDAGDSEFMVLAKQVEETEGDSAEAFAQKMLDFF